MNVARNTADSTAESSAEQPAMMSFTSCQLPLQPLLIPVFSCRAHKGVSGGGDYDNFSAYMKEKRAHCVTFKWEMVKMWMKYEHSDRTPFLTLSELCQMYKSLSCQPHDHAIVVSLLARS